MVTQNRLSSKQDVGWPPFLDREMSLCQWNGRIVGILAWNGTKSFIKIAGMGMELYFGFKKTAISNRKEDISKKVWN